MMGSNQSINPEPSIAIHPASPGTQLLRDAEISSYLNSHQGAAENIRRAADLLANEADGLKSLHKLLPALTHKTINVFFSYKAKDEKTAKSVVDILRKKSADKLAITYQAEFTENISGKPWRDKITTEICKANWFILLLPDPSDDWDWCLFETGIFEGQQSSADRLICLHHPEIAVPDPIEGYHAVAARPSEVEKFLRMVFINKDPLYGLDPVNPSLEENLPEIANRIVEAISPPRKNLFKQPLMPWVEICVEDPHSMTRIEDLNRAVIRYANKDALDIFDFLDQPDRWGDLVDVIEKCTNDSRWQNELFHVIRKIGSGRRFEPIQAVFNTASDKIYKPVVCAIDRLGRKGKIDSFQIGFIEEVGAINTAEIPLELSALATTLRYAFRFRWEILEKFAPLDLDDEDIIALDNTLQRIEHDAESRGVSDEESLKSLFPSKQETDEISQMYRVWYRLRNQQGTGELDIAIRDRDAEKVKVILNELTPMNRRFLNMTAERFGSLVSNTA
ncbi:MAG: hypothetical protein AB2602_06365 [Candidatus Thiodiazotropha sp.]